VVEFVDGLAKMSGAAAGLEAAEAFRRFILEADPVHEGVGPGRKLDARPTA
jgi:hypothetical protein